MADHVSSLIVRLVDQVTAPSRAVANSMRQLQGRINAATEANKAALAGMRGQLVDAVAGGYALKKALSAPIEAAVEFETLMEDIGQKTSLSGSALGDLGKTIRKLARDTNVSTMEMGKGMDFLLGMGLGGETDAENIKAAAALAPVAAKAAVAYRSSTEDMAKTAHAAFQNMKVPLSEMMRTFDALASTAAAGGFEFRDMAQHFPSLTSMAHALGMAGREGMADLAAALQVARKGAGDAAEAANNLLNVLQKVQSPTTRKNFQKFGIDISKSVEDGLKKGVSPIETLATETQKALKKGAKISDLFEDRQAQLGLIAIMNDMAEYRRLRADALKASGLVEEAFERRTKTAASATARFKAALENLNITIGSSLLPAFTDLLNTLGRVFGFVEQFAEKNPKLARTIVMVASGLIATRVAAIAAGYSFLLMRGGLLSIAGLAVGAARGLGAVGKAVLIAPVVRTAAAAFGGLRSAMVGFAAVAAIAGNGAALRTLGASLLGLLNPLRLVRAAMVAIRVALISTGVGAVAVGLAAAGLWIANNWKGIQELFIGVGDGFMKGLGPARAIIEPIANAAKRLYDAIAGMLGPLKASQEDWRAWGETIGKYVAGGVKTVADGIQSIISNAKAAYDAILKIGSALASLNPFGGGGDVGGGPAASGRGKPKGAHYGAPAVDGARASGGPVIGGRTYLVGERGPEIFSPGRSGAITPNHKIGGRTVTVNAPITIHAQTGDPEAIAREVSRRLGRFVGGSHRGAFDDTAYA